MAWKKVRTLVWVVQHLRWKEFPSADRQIDFLMTAIAHKTNRLVPLLFLWSEIQESMLWPKAHD